MRRVGCVVALVVLAGLAVLLLAPAALAQNPLSCADFPFQAAAQAHLRANLYGASSLDGNNNGIACETYPYPPKSPREEGPVTPPQRPQVIEQGVTQQPPPLPKSGGLSVGSMLWSSPTLLLGLLLLILGSLMFAYTRVLR
jgi:Excalibur calcium-binding domain